MKKAAISEHSQTDWAHVDSIQDEEIDISDAAEVPSEICLQGVVRQGLMPVSRKAQVTLQELELQHADGYINHPMLASEIDVWSSEQYWGEP